MKLTVVLSPALREPIVERLRDYRLQSNRCQSTITTHVANGYTTVKIYGPTTDIHKAEAAIRRTIADIERERIRALRRARRAAKHQESVMLTESTI